MRGVDHGAGIQWVADRRATTTSRYPSPWWRILLQEPGVRPAMISRAEQRMHRPGLARPLLAHELKPNGDLRPTVKVPLEIEHLLVAETTWLARQIDGHRRKDVALANHIEWQGDLWARPPRTKSDRRRTNGAIHSATQLISTQGPLAVKGDVAAYFPSLRPRFWATALHQATGIPHVDLGRQLRRLRDLAVEIADALGQVGLPVGTELSDIVGNAVLYPMDDALVERLGSAGYARYVDDFACAVRTLDAGLRLAALVEREHLAPLGLRMNWEKVRVMASADLRLVGDGYEVGDDPDAAPEPRWGEAFFMSRPAARGFIRARLESGTDADAMRLAAMTPRLLSATVDQRKALRTFGTPLPGDIASTVVASLCEAQRYAATVSSSGDLLLGLLEGGLDRIDEVGRRGLGRSRLDPLDEPPHGQLCGMGPGQIRRDLGPPHPRTHRGHGPERGSWRRWRGSGRRPVPRPRSAPACTSSRGVSLRRRPAGRPAAGDSRECLRGGVEGGDASRRRRVGPRGGDHRDPRAPRTGDRSRRPS